jgi:hypothetical protein
MEATPTCGVSVPPMADAFRPSRSEQRAIVLVVVPSGQCPTVRPLTSLPQSAAELTNEARPGGSAAADHSAVNAPAVAEAQITAAIVLPSHRRLIHPHRFRVSDQTLLKPMVTPLTIVCGTPCSAAVGFVGERNAAGGGTPPSRAPAGSRQRRVRLVNAPGAGADAVGCIQIEHRDLVGGSLVDLGF